jgi:hypothetical protein
VENADFAGLRDAAESLTPYAVEIRYPGERLQLSRADVREALAGAEMTWRFVLKCLPHNLVASAELCLSVTEEAAE